MNDECRGILGIPAKEYGDSQLLRDALWWRGAHIAEAMLCVTVIVAELLALVL